MGEGTFTQCQPQVSMDLDVALALIWRGLTQTLVRYKRRQIFGRPFTKLPHRSWFLDASSLRN